MAEQPPANNPQLYAEMTQLYRTLLAALTAYNSDMGDLGDDLLYELSPDDASTVPACGSAPPRASAGWRGLISTAASRAR